jgi:hypothetical protein
VGRHHLARRFVESMDLRKSTSGRDNCAPV